MSQSETSPVTQNETPGTFHFDSLFRATKKDIRLDVLNFRAIDGARTRGLDLGKVARYQLRHYRIYVKSLSRQQNK